MAWQLLTDVYKLPHDRLYVTYFAGNETWNLAPDLECRDIWHEIGVPENRILPFGELCKIAGEFILMSNFYIPDFFFT